MSSCIKALHTWHDIIENPSEKVIGRHCFACGTTETHTPTQEDE